MSKKKILEQEIRDLAGKLADKTTGGARVFALGVPAIIGAGAIVHGYNESQDRARGYKQTRIQQGNLDRQLDRAMQNQSIGISDPQSNAGLVQEMYNQRNGHSNTWGGVKY